MSEASIIATLLARIPHHPAPLGPGDDAALLRAGPTRVLTTDALVEGTHFTERHPPEALGWKALAVNLSDVAAMGATPEAFTLALALPDGTPTAWVRAFADGLGACARAAGVELAGGDTVRAPRGATSIVITAWGRLVGAPLRRSGGEAGDVLVVAGHVGRSGVGLGRWLAGAAADLADPVLAAHLRPEPPLWAGPRASSAGAHAGMDLSDGLATDLPRLAEASRVELVVDLDRLPDDPVLRALGISAPERAAFGEDYGFVALVPPHITVPGFCAIGHARAVHASAHDEEPRTSHRLVIWREHGREVAPISPAFAHFSDDY